MNRAKKIEHCYNCDMIIQNVESFEVTDVSEYSLQRDDPWDGTYYLRYKICPKCGKPNSTSEWHNSLEGYDKIINFKI